MSPSEQAGFGAFFIVIGVAICSYEIWRLRNRQSERQGKGVYETVRKINDNIIEYNNSKRLSVGVILIFAGLYCFFS